MGYFEVDFDDGWDDGWNDIKYQEGIRLNLMVKPEL